MNNSNESEQEFTYQELIDKLALAVSRANRIKSARDEAERLLEEKSRQLYESNQKLERARKGLEDDIKQATYELSVSNKRLQKALDERSAFIGQMSHEVRTPLNAVIGLSEILLKTELDDTQVDFVRTIHTGAHSLVSLLNDMLDITKVEAGKLELKLQPVLIKEMIQNVISMFEVEAQKKGLLLTLYIDSAVPKLVMIDRIRYIQIVNNLISNAIKNTELGFVNVSLFYEDDKYASGIGALVLQTIDTGIGIAPQQIKRIFNAYEQLGFSSEGVGLGLAISKQLSDLMHGKITCRSDIGKGATFELTIPSERVVTDEKIKDLASNTKPLSNVPLRILVAEDNVTNQKVLTAQLAQLGQKATIVNNGREALTELNKDKFDVVFLDILMPIMDGEETLAAIRASSQDITEHYCVALTASNYKDQKKRLLNNGFDDFLSKPLALLDLDLALQKVIARQLTSPLTSNTLQIAPSIERESVKDTGFDMTFFNEQFGELSHDIFADIAPTFIDHTRTDINELSNAINNNNNDAIRKFSHSIKGGASSMGLVTLAELLETLERNPTSISVKDCFIEIETLWHKVEAQIQHTLDGINRGAQ